MMSIYGTVEGMSALGASWVNQGSASPVDETVRIERDKGRLTATEVYVQSKDGNGDCILIMEGNDLKVLNENGVFVASIQSNIN